MPVSCSAPGCTKRFEKGSGIQLFRFPLSQPDRLNKWLIKMSRLPAPGKKSNRPDGLWEPKEHDRLCSLHFLKGKPVKDPENIDYVPSIFSHTPVVKKTPDVIQQKISRQDRVKQLNEKRTKTAAALALLGLSKTVDNSVPGVATQTVVTTSDVGTQTEWEGPVLEGFVELNVSQNEVINDQRSVIDDLLSAHKVKQQQFEILLKEVSNLKDKLTVLENENESLTRKVQTCLNCAFIQDSDKRTAFYTGLPNYATFLVVFNHAKQVVKRKNTKLDLEDELLLTLVKLKLNPTTEDLGYRFGISSGLVNRIFHAWLDALYKTVGGLVIWPPCDKELQLPEVFNTNEFRKVKCVIDCTEIFIERPSSLKARAQTYSNYKRHNTVKVLVGISPSGSVTFISNCWGGRASDKKITVECGLLDKFVPGDIVMADRGFLVEDEFAMRQVKLIMPAFTKGKSQLSAEEVEKSRQMSRARIHVERLIGRLKDFRIIGGTMPVAFVKKKGTCKKVLHVVGGIVNMNSPLL